MHPGRLRIAFIALTLSDSPGVVIFPQAIRKPTTVTTPRRLILRLFYGDFTVIPRLFYGDFPAISILQVRLQAPGPGAPRGRRA